MFSSCEKAEITDDRFVDMTIATAMQQHSSANTIIVSVNEIAKDCQLYAYRYRVSNIADYFLIIY